LVTNYSHAEEATTQNFHDAGLCLLQGKDEKILVDSFSRLNKI